MRISHVVGAVSLWGSVSGLANPLAVDSSRRMVTMIAEDVRVLVGAGESKVSGVYKFRLEPPYTVDRADAHVDIRVPVLWARNEEDLAGRRPVVRLQGREFTNVETKKGELSSYGIEPLPVGRSEIPKGWHARFFLFQIPVRLLKEEFKVTVDYVQPHFPGDVVGYIPLDPPLEPGAARIRFEAAKGRALKKTGGLDLFSKPVATLEVKPQNRKLIKVRSVPSRE